MKYAIKRKLTKTVMVGGVAVGGGNPVTVQSMTNTDTRDAKATIRQILELEDEGCEIVRVAVPDAHAAAALAEIKNAAHIPVAADIHYDWRLALMALDAGVDKLRINPGNIGDRDKVREVARKARERGVPIRIGVNGGSIEKRLTAHGGGVTPEVMVDSAMHHIHILEEVGFYDIIVSMKASSAPLTVQACSLFAEKSDYPQHIGITEAGTSYGGGIKSAAGIGALLFMGIGDTLRVSLTGDPLQEVRCGREILKAMELRRFGPEIVSCPTCGRTAIDAAGLAERIEKAVRHIKKPIKIAVMGCSVNGPGEAADADVAITGGAGMGAIYRNGKVVKTVSEEQLFTELMREINEF